MRGRGRGRGRGGGGRYLDEGPKQGPVTVAPLAYPANPGLAVYRDGSQTPPALSAEQQALVAVHRILVNFWRYDSFFHVAAADPRPAVETLAAASSAAAATDLGAQRDAIVALTEPRFFPPELLMDSFSPGARRRPPPPPRRQPVTSKTVVAADEDAAPADGEAPPQDEDEEDFGGEDYAANYDDEDRADSDVDDGGGAADDAF